VWFYSTHEAKSQKILKTSEN